MKNYINTFILLEDVISYIIPDEEIKYNKSLFIRDLFESENIDWEIYLGRLLDKANDAEIKVIELLDKFDFPYLEEHKESTLESNDNYKSFENHRGRIVLLRAEHFNQEYQSFSKLMRCLEMLKSLKEDIPVCLEYFLKESEVPPFKEVLIKLNKIPFFGDEVEFVSFFVLLIHVGLIGVKESEVKYSDLFNLDEGLHEELAKELISKRSLISILTRNFYGIEISNDSNKLIEKFFNSKSVESKFSLNGIKRGGDFPRLNLINKFKKAIEILETIKSPKNKKEFEYFPKNIKK